MPSNVGVFLFAQGTFFIVRGMRVPFDKAGRMQVVSTAGKLVQLNIGTSKRMLTAKT
jgi:hypothetical protein